MVAMSTIGDRIRFLREDRGWSINELARRAKISTDGLWRIETDKVKKPYTLRKIADALGVEINDLRSSGHAPSGIEPIESADFSTIPEWEIDVRASTWAHAPICRLDPDDFAQAQVLRTGRFRLRIVGDCMAPDFPSGSTVEFQMVRVQDDPLEPGRDYVVCKSDETATFKRLAKLDDDSLVLVALNQADYPGEIIVARQEVVRMAVAESKVIRLGAGKVPKVRRVK